MKPELIRHQKANKKAVLYQNIEVPYFEFPWHYHPELELILVIQGHGTRFIGDSIQTFEPGDLVLLGKNVPHQWKNSSSHYAIPSKSMAKAIVVHFEENFHGSDFSALSEMKFLDSIYSKALRGIKIQGHAHKEISNTLLRMNEQTDFKRVLCLFSILNIIDKSEHCEYLASEAFARQFFEFKDQRFNTVYHYIMQNFHRTIRLAEVASLANLSPTTFCRFFKKHTGKSFSSFLKDLRISYASRLLIEENHAIEQIAYMSGYHNISNFIKHFKQLKKMTPSKYRKANEYLVSYSYNLNKSD
ncbi:AraC family transcriptional regulator [Tamlana sp. I1]|uniref:AraC family transcriptional regulator n=1 Tax=Tamlana sp. I1 TaxID=2762061 RepID=UPI0018900AE9|nr:AraC family transcriptional regulator [Tamlana sp. I1]